MMYDIPKTPGYREPPCNPWRAPSAFGDVTAMGPRIDLVTFQSRCRLAGSNPASGRPHRPYSEGGITRLRFRRLADNVALSFGAEQWDSLKELCSTDLEDPHC